MAKRPSFAEAVVALTPAQVKAKLPMNMDGVVLAMPPRDYVERVNYCRSGEDHV